MLREGCGWSALVRVLSRKEKKEERESVEQNRGERECRARVS